MSGDNTAFFYGTLMAPEVFFSVCYGDKNPPKVIKDLHTFTPAILEGYCRHRVQFADYPGVIAEKGHTVLGIYATGLTDANVQKLDNFEGSEYTKTAVQVKLMKKDGDKTSEGERKETSVYVFNNPSHLEKVEWDFEEFRKEKMQFWTRGGWAFDAGKSLILIRKATFADATGPETADQIPDN
ncbi:putative gamma-glutamylcyclotransferase [Fusarium keratoplasticum]|uniref:Gamma-glutamylcyclotransferase n=1 Tax=Fusarium keratoplasticum TaxID=1328300 RepID=A0ACC0QK17_9HYPO|nr:putative gamma-glutamylcyclotransferase [Fusarium keratoplasticum]KAI8657652.1 putative gamma-glutamylcyclotransferase [Fusarium keratoplasticum]KAI8658616.1 putative gamma-glutamylcyclotransferase [Fusarium keratoplasticum]